MMNRSQYAQGSGVVVDLCRDHGSYYDRGELTRIFNFIESGGLAKARQRQAASLRADLRDLRRKAITAGRGQDLSLEGACAEGSGLSALDVVRSIAAYLRGKRSANSE